MPRMKKSIRAYGVVFWLAVKKLIQALKTQCQGENYSHLMSLGDKVWAQEDLLLLLKKRNRMDEIKMDFIGKESLSKVCQKPSASAVRSNCNDLNYSLQLLQDSQVISDHSLLSPTEQEDLQEEHLHELVPVARYTAQRLESCSHKLHNGEK